jgi:hypothetical protein
MIHTFSSFTISS